MRTESGGPQHMDREGSSVNLKNSLQLTYKTICKNCFLEEEKPKTTKLRLTKSSSKDCISEMNEEMLDCV